MTAYEYKVVPAPTRGEKARGVRGNEARFACALERLMNDMGAEGWEYQRAETLPSEERSGLTSTTRTYRNVLVFRRALNGATAAQPLILENPTQVPLRLTRPLPQGAHRERLPHESPDLSDETRPEAPASDMAPEPEAQPAPPADVATAPRGIRPPAAPPAASLWAAPPQPAMPDPAGYGPDDEDDADAFVLRPRDGSVQQPEPEPQAAKPSERPPDPDQPPRSAGPTTKPAPQPPRAPRRTAALLDDNGVEGTEPVVGLGAALRARAARLRRQQDDVAAE